MKRKFVYILLGLMAAAALSACGDTRVDNTPSVTSTPKITDMPIVSPDPDDGIVDDMDGILKKDEDDGIVNMTPAPENNGSGSSMATARPSSSPSPAATAKP